MRKYIIWYLACAMFVIGIVPRAEAAFLPSESLASSPADRTHDMGRLQAVLESKMVQQRLKDLGYSVDEITARMAELSDEQLHSLASKLDELKTGGDGLGVVIALLVIAILVVLLIQLSGHRIAVR